jgi:heme a synthase
MKSRWLHRFAILLAALSLLLIVDGALVVPGTQPAPQTLSLHRLAGFALDTLTVVLVIWLVAADSRRQTRNLGWIVLIIAIAEGVAGLASVQAAVPRTAGIAHACLAQMFFAAMIAVALVTSAAWNRGPEFVNDYGWPSMRSLAIFTPLLVILQIMLGAGFRQKALTLLPHVLGAMFVALVILLESIFVLQQFPVHRSLRPAAKTLLGVAFAQVFLGMTALIMKSMANDTDAAVIATVAAHITGGAITLATTVALSILIRRNVQPRVEEDIEEPAAT